MITYSVSRYYGHNPQKHYIEGECLSTDTKPTNVMNGSKLMEMDTGKLYLFDEANSQWREWS